MDITPQQQTILTDTTQTTQTTTTTNTSQLKKLYFKPSNAATSTSILSTNNDSTVLLKSRSTLLSRHLSFNEPNHNNQITTTALQGAIAATSTLQQKFAPKLNTVTFNLSQHQQQQQQQQLQSSMNETNNSNSNSYSNDEFESPLKLKETIQLSIRNLKPTLAGLDLLRSSTSDDDDSYHFDLNNSNDKKYKLNNNINNNSNNQTQNTNLKFNIPQNSVNVSNSSNNSSTTTTTTTITTPIAKTTQINPISRHNYVRTPHRSTYYQPQSQSSSSLNTNILPTTIVTPIYKPNQNQFNVNSTKHSGKRGKEEALSNSSSSDEEELQQQQQQQQQKQHQDQHLPSSSQKLQQLLSHSSTTSTTTTPIIQPQLSNVPLKLPMATNSLNFNNNLRQQHYTITPIAANPQISHHHQQQLNNSIITTVVNHNNNTNNNNITTTVNNANNIEKQSDMMTIGQDQNNNNINITPIKIQSKTMDHEFDNKHNINPSNISPNNQSPILSSTSSVCSFSSVQSVMSPSSTNEANDLQDDNSSTASGPIYVRQPGFEHHAHEVTLAQCPNSNRTSRENLKKTSEKLNNSSNTKAKKKLCISMSNTSSSSSNSSTTSTLPISTYQTSNSTNQNTNNNSLTINNNNSTNTINENLSHENNKNQGIQLKPIKHKRDPLPMRLRALPPSFWQQPNQSNVSPGSMCLPPLFKHDSDDEESGIDDEVIVPKKPQKNSKDVKISPANTDLLFKLFDDIDQKDKKLHHLLAQQRKLKPSRKPLKGLSKNLIKGDDPCILDAVAEGLFPLLTLDSRNETVHYLTLKSDCNLTSNGLSNSSPMLSSTSTTTNILPSLEQNYSQALSEVVAAL